MKRNGAELEADADDDEREAEEHPDVRAVARAGYERNVREFEMTGDPVNDGHAVEKRPGGHGAQDEIFDRRFGRDPGIAVESHHSVEAERHELEAQIEGDQTGRGNQHHRAQRGKEPEHEVFALEDRAALQVVGGIDEHHRHREQRDHFEDLRHPIQLVEAAQRDDPLTHGLDRRQHRGREQREDRQHARPGPARVGKQKIEHEDRARGHPEKNLR